MDPFSNGDHDGASPSGINDPLSGLDSSFGLGGDVADYNDDSSIFSLPGGTSTIDNAVHSAVPSPLSQFNNLNLNSTAGNTLGRGGERDVEIDNDEDDPFAALEAAIEEDKPK
jgi:hypothetical protein